MTVILIVFFSAVLTILIVSLFVPVFRGVRSGADFYIAGSERRNRRALLRLTVEANLRDLQIEREAGKLTEDDFQSLALPLAHQLERLGAPVQSSVAPGTSKGNRRFCSACGYRTGESVCLQCGSVLS